MAWVPGFVEFSAALEQQNCYEGNIQINKVNEVVFHGVVTEDDGRHPVAGALVKVFARVGEQQELPLSHTISGKDGHYLLYIDKESVPKDTTAIIIRANAGNPNHG